MLETYLHKLRYTSPEISPEKYREMYTYFESLENPHPTIWEILHYIFIESNPWHRCRRLL